MKTKIDYTSKEIIFYKFICNDPTIISTYVGHTIHFIKRKSDHKRNCLNEHRKQYNLLLYKMIRDTGGWDNWNMFEIERLIVSSKQEAFQREQYWIDLQVEKLNMYNAVKHLDKKQYNKQYHEQNKKQISLKDKEYRQQNKEQISLKKKEFLKQNKEQINIKRRENYEQNKEQINLKRREKTISNKELNLMSNEDKY